MVRYLIGARRGHGKHRVPGVGRDVGGQNLGVGQGDWAAPQRHQNAAALGVGGKAGGGGKVGTCGSSGTGRPRGTGCPCRARRAGEMCIRDRPPIGHLCLRGRLRQLQPGGGKALPLVHGGDEAAQRPGAAPGAEAAGAHKAGDRPDPGGRGHLPLRQTDVRRLGTGAAGGAGGRPGGPVCLLCGNLLSLIHI